MTSEHLFKFSQLGPQEKTEGGTRTKASKQNFPILSGMSLYKLVLYPHGVREPHWHANADELGFCLGGEVLISIYDTSDIKATYLVKSGEAFFIPSGALHDVENAGEQNAELILCFSSDTVEDFGLSGTMGAFTNAVLGNTWSVNQKVFENFKRSTANTFASLSKKTPITPDEASYATPYRFNLLGSEPILENEGGSARMARQIYWPILKRQALYSLVLTGKGMREPHWHPETSELGFVNKGRGRMSILSPSGKVDTYIMEEGDIYFIPKAYPHHIENLEGEPLHLLIFFDQAMPKDIGFTGSVKSYSNETLASITHQPPQLFEGLPKYYQDLFIVTKTNPLD